MDYKGSQYLQRPLLPSSTPDTGYHLQAQGLLAEMKSLLRMLTGKKSKGKKIKNVQSGFIWCRGKRNSVEIPGLS